MINASQTVRMSRRYQTVHSFLLEAIHRWERLRLVLASHRISLFVLNCIPLKPELLIRATPQFQWSSTNQFLFSLIQLTTVEEISQSNLFAWSYGCIGNQRKKRSTSYFGLIFVIFGCFEEMVTLSRRVTSSVAFLRHAWNVDGISFPVWVVWFSQKWAHMFSIPGISVESFRVRVVKEEPCFGKFLWF